MYERTSIKYCAILAVVARICEPSLEQLSFGPYPNNLALDLAPTT